MSKKLNTQVEEFRTRILNVLNDRFIELTDEGLTSNFKVEFRQYDHLKYIGGGKVSTYYTRKHNLFEFNNSFRVWLEKSKLYDFLQSKVINTNSDTNIDRYIIDYNEHTRIYNRVYNEYLNNISDIGEYFEYDVFIRYSSCFEFKKKQ